MRKLISIFVFSILLASCSSMPNKNIKASDEKGSAIVGIWSMMPLRNGIANVVEFTKEGESNLYTFNCRNKSSGEVESASYTINEDGKNIRIDSNGNIQSLNVISINGNTMILGQKVGDDLLKFSYIRTGRISPLCFLYKESAQEKSKRTAFNESEFIHDPWIPDSKKIARYVGKWVDEKGSVQIEVNKDASGKYKIFHQSNENWNYLYNDVHWSGDELIYRSFAYSDKQDLFDHPYHKASHIAMLTAIDDLDKIKWTIFFGRERVDYILYRK